MQVLQLALRTDIQFALNLKRSYSSFCSKTFTVRLNVQHEESIGPFYVSVGKSQSSCLFSSTNCRLAEEGQAGKFLVSDIAIFWSDEYLIRQVSTMWKVEAAIAPSRLSAVSA